MVGLEGRGERRKKRRKEGEKWALLFPSSSKPLSAPQTGTWKLAGSHIDESISKVRRSQEQRGRAEEARGFGWPCSPP